jgi:PAS domain S-box-containing protein
MAADSFSPELQVELSWFATDLRWPSHSSKDRPAWIEPALLALAYLACAELGHFLSMAPGAFATVWPASGLLVAALVSRPSGEWSRLLLATMAANFASDVLFHDRALATSAGFWAANVAEACVGAALIRRHFRAPFLCSSPQQVIGLTVLSGLLSTTIGATMGMATLSLTSPIPGSWSSWKVWWGADALGVVLVAPLLLMGRDDNGPTSRTGRLLRLAEWGLSMALMLSMVGYAFSLATPPRQPIWRLPYSYSMPFLLWSGVRFGPRAGAIVSLLFCLVVARSTAHGTGPFVWLTSTANERAELLQIFLTSVLFTSTLLSSAVAGLRRMQQRLLASEEAYRSLASFQRAILDAANYTVISATPDGTIRAFNAAAERWLGYDADEVIGKVTPAIIHDPDEVAARAAVLSDELGRRVEPGFEAFVARARLGEVDERDWTYVRKDGGRFPVRLSITALRDGEGRITGFLGIGSDITEEVAAREALRRAHEELEARVDERTEDLARANDRLREGERKFRQLADAMPQIVWTARPDGCLDYYNERWYDFTGFERDGRGDESWKPILHPDDLRRSLATWYHSVATGEPYEIQYRFRDRKTGRFRWHLGRALPVRDDAGRIAGWFGTCTDIDDYKQTEEALRESEAAIRLLNADLERRVESRTAELTRAKESAEIAARAKGEFLANMSHEIRTPMNGILGMTELMLRTPMSATQSEYLGLVKSSADSLLVVIDDILDFSKLDAGKMILDPAPFALRDAVTTTLRTLNHRADEKGLELACRIDADVPQAVIGDAGRFRQVLVNLVGNALKFTDRGEVVVTLEAREDSGDEFVVLCSVADTGIGVPPEKREDIFRAFEQADGSTTRRFGGTGLGLTISARLSALMGGRIWIEENPGGGTIFRFTTRLVRDRKADGRCPAAGPRSIAGRRLLVVDDNRTNRLILQELLGGWGASVVAVDGGRAALAAIAEAGESGAPFDAALIDRMMPTMDGTELVERIRRDPVAARLPILILTSGGPADAERLRDMGVAAVLSKPIHSSEIFDTLTGALADPAVAATVEETVPEPSGGVGPAGDRLRILLAEDHPINRRVAVGMLEEMGHAVSIVGDGRAAVGAWESGDFDVVLMDVQMPVMDGFEAVAEIRRREAGSGRHVPIVALTAHAMKGDRDRCRDAGFDEYISKPVSSEKLREVLCGRGGAGGEPPSEAAAEIDLSEFDPEAARVSVGGDEPLLIELLGIFFDDWPRLMAEIRTAVESGDGPNLARLAHTLAGVGGTFGAAGVVAAARRLETIAKAKPLADADDARDALVAAVGRFRTAVAGSYDVFPGGS